MSATHRRLVKELQSAMRDKDPDFHVRVPDDENLYRWEAFLRGPSDTCFAGGVFKVILDVPKSFPIEPPKGKFETKIFHPNVDWKTGNICVDILSESWSPTWTMTTICRAILLLMSQPVPDSPLNCDAGNLLRTGDVRAYNSMAKMYTKQYAHVNAENGQAKQSPLR